MVKADAEVYTNLTRDIAKTQAEKLYDNEDDSVESSLISSYAWDTMLNFICQTHEEGYKLATTNDKKYGNIATGKITKTGEYKQDKYNNIFDIIGNIHELTTGYSKKSGEEYVIRGGNSINNTNFASQRYSIGSIYKSSTIGFRTQLYIK